MKKTSPVIRWVLMTFGAFWVGSGCSHMPGQTEPGKELSATGPTVTNVRSEPSTIELDRRLRPVRTPEILADIKDFHSKVTQVKLQFVHVPLQVPMENIGGTTWRAQITSDQLKTLAVAGKTSRYTANVEAKDASGRSAVGQSPVTVVIKAPEVSSRSTS